jgi:hypothetical protein
MLIAPHYISTQGKRGRAERSSETRSPTHFFARPPAVIVDSRWTRFGRLLAKFDTPLGDVALEHGEDFAVTFDIHNSQA